jgi:hypothetical protein
MPHGLIGGSDSFQIKSVLIRRLLFWTLPFLLVGLILSAIIVASNADACDYEDQKGLNGCRITKDTFGNLQIVNVVFISVASIVLLVHLRNMWRLSGNLLQAGSIPTNEKHSLMIGGMTLLTLVLAAANLTIGFGFLYKQNDHLNEACMANRRPGLSSVLAWSLLVATLMLSFILVIGVGGYAGVSGGGSVSQPTMA